MNHLLIIGNGFDLAHGLETGYQHFIDNIKHGKKHPERISLMKNIQAQYLEGSSGFYVDYFDQEDNEGVEGKSLFLLHLLNKTSVENWCDIENEYFNLILEDSQKKDKRLIKKINMDFERVKNYLRIYLLEQESKGGCIDTYSDLFQCLCNHSNGQNALIVNFNYTNTVQRLYSEQIKDAKLIHIHGELNNNENPLIFGYAADENQINLLLDIEENQYLHNIKRYSYKRTNNENIIKQFLDDKKYLHVHILGHSCGVSDRLILETIFNHQNICNIVVYYHDCFENYRDTTVNIHRISKMKTSYDKILEFPKSCRMPQFSDPVNKKHFSNCLSNYIKIENSLKQINAIKGMIM